jgi:hypothetical protein
MTRKPPLPLSTASTFLTPAEVFELTHKQRAAAQAKVLNAMGITHKIRPDNTVLVLRSHVETVLGGHAPWAKTNKLPQPKFEELT